MPLGVLLFSSSRNSQELQPLCQKQKRKVERSSTRPRIRDCLSTLPLANIQDWTRNVLNRILAVKTAENGSAAPFHTSASPESLKDFKQWIKECRSQKNAASSKAALLWDAHNLHNLYEQLSLSWNKTAVATVCWLVAADPLKLLQLSCGQILCPDRCYGTTKWWWTHLVHFWRWWLARPRRSSWSSAGSWPNSPMRLEQEEKEKAERGVMWRVFHWLIMGWVVCFWYHPHVEANPLT